MRRAAVCVLLLTCSVALAGATPQGFTKDFDQATRDALASGKSVFVYFNLNG